MGSLLVRPDAGSGGLAALTDLQREALLQLTPLFQAGEASVTLDLLSR